MITATALSVVILTTWARSGYVSHVPVLADKCEMLRAIELRNKDVDRPWAIYRAECSNPGASKQASNLS